MKRVYKLTLGLALLGLGTAAVAQVYKWVDARGVTHYSDQPPPPEQKKVEVKSLNGNGESGVALPYEVAQAARTAPVTLFTTPGCEACDQARRALQRRGVPYSEKSVTSADDQAKLKEAGGGNQLPFILIGSTRQVGFESGALDRALTIAGYPATNSLPSNYRYGPATAAAPPRPSPEQMAQAEAKARAKAEAEQAERKQAVPPKPDFQF